MIKIIVDDHQFLIDPRTQLMRYQSQLSLSKWYTFEVVSDDVENQFNVYPDLIKYPFKKALDKYKKLKAFA